MTRALMLSLLTRQSLFLKEQFGARYPNAWLVWEPGAWAAPPKAAEQNLLLTRVPSARPPTRPPGMDALCFELPAGAAEVRLGRASESEIVINDATVSRTHLVLRPRGSGWEVEAASERPTRVAGVALAPGRPLALVAGAELLAGDVRLTYYDPAGLLVRLRREGEAAAKRVNV